MTARETRFVADGWERLKRTPEFRQRCELIEAKVRSKYAAELAAASGFWQRKKLQWRISREVNREMKQTGTAHSLWLSR
jgi:hypothetical protein